MAKNGDLVQLRNSKDVGIVIDDFDPEMFKSLNTAYIAHMSRKILVFKESGPEIDFVPNFNIVLVENKKENNDTKI